MLFWLTANLCNFIASFTLPYLLQEPANLGSRVGLIYGSISAMGLVWGFFCMPEMAKKSLEEIDEMFAAGVPAWKSRRESIPHLNIIREITLTQVSQIGEESKLQRLPTSRTTVSQVIPKVRGVLRNRTSSPLWRRSL